jgi:hypothetical protein
VTDEFSLGGVKPLAGLRGAFWDASRLPADVRLTAHALKTQDGQTVSGFLHACGNESSVVVMAHPREHLVPHFLVPELLTGGAAVFQQAPRLTGNDIRLEHEIALHDLAAAIIFLRSSGFKKIYALGNSGGGPLWAFYNQQSLLPPSARITRTPGGRSTKLDSADMPLLDGLIFLSTHLGQGKLLLNCIDPSVIDEGDAFSIDPSLDPFSPENGYEPDGKARYSPDFVTRYREAQAQRVKRIDTKALEDIAERAKARRRVKAGDHTRLDLARVSHTPIFNVWRTDADLRCWDLSIDPSDRRAGSLWGSNPLVSNYGAMGFGRVCTPESWLSTWSGITTNASMQKCAPSIEQPTLLIEFTGDASTFPQEVDELYALIGTSNKQRAAYQGDHQAQRLIPDGPDPKFAAGERIREWLQAQ